MFQEQGLNPLPKHYGPDNITWDDYERIGVEFVRREKPLRWGSMMAYGGTCYNSLWMLDPHLWSYGTSAADHDDRTKCLLGEPPAQEHLEWIRRQLWDTHMMAFGEAMGGIANEQMFASQRIAMLEMGPWNYGPIAEVCRFKWDLAPLPNGPTGKSYNRASTNSNHIWKGTPHPDEAWEVLKFLQSPRWHRALAENTFEQPARLSVFPYYYRALREAHPVFEDMNLEIMGEAVGKGLIRGESFFWPKPEESIDVMRNGMDEVLTLGKEPVSYMKEIADKITQLNREALSA